MYAVHTDASYLSETYSRSRAGGVHMLTDASPPDQLKVNGPVECISTIIPTVVSSAFEAEYAAMFINGNTAAGIRNTLADLNYPQAATPMTSDNSCAVGIANKTVKQRRSKAIDMRYHWIRDRVKRGQFLVHWLPGTKNLADFFTKAHPVANHRHMRQFFVRMQPLAKPRDNAHSRRSARHKATLKL